ncbi:hypothetical protein ACFSLT_21310 [Novosphingobium resinovorum]
MSANPPMDYFVQEAVGFRVLMILMQSVRGNPDNRTAPGFYSRVGGQGGVSRTHVRNVLKGAAERGFVTLSERPGDYVELSQTLIDAFDRWVGRVYRRSIGSVRSADTLSINLSPLRDLRRQRA